MLHYHQTDHSTQRLRAGTTTTRRWLSNITSVHGPSLTALYCTVQVDDAFEVYRADLSLELPVAERPPCPHPNNVWSLRGAILCLEAKDFTGGASTAASREHFAIHQEQLLAGLRAQLQALPGGSEVRSSCLCSSGVHAQPSL